MATAATILATKRDVETAFVLEIEGYNVAFTTHQDTAALAASWSTWTNFIAGLENPGGLSRSMKLLLPKFDGPSVSLDLVDVDGTLVSLFADADTAVITTVTTADVTRTATTIQVISTAAFPASGTIYIGHERITYTGKTATTFTGCTRGTFPFGGKSSWAYSYRIDDSQLGVEVRSKPAIWKGRGVNLYLTVIDPATNAWVSKANALLWFAGVIDSGSRSSDGMWHLSCSSVEKHGRRSLLSEQFTARYSGGFDIVGVDATLRVAEMATRSGALPAYSKDTTVTITAQHYSLSEYMQAVTTALKAAKTAADLVNDWSLSLNSENLLVVTVFDATAHDAGDSFLIIFQPTERVQKLLGDPNPIGGVGMPTSGTGHTMEIISYRRPMVSLITPWQGSIDVDGVDGTWIVQPTDEISPLTTGAEGYIQIGEDSDVLIGVTYNASTHTFTRKGRIRFNGQQGEGGGWTNQILLGVVRAGDEGDVLPVRQVYWTVPLPVSTVLRRMLMSTGSSGYNDATHDVWAEQMGLGIPSTLIDIPSLQLLDSWTMRASMILLEPTPAEDYLDSFAGVLGFLLTWRAGKIALVLPNTIGGLPSSVTLGTDVQIEPADMDFGGDDIANVVTLNYNLDALTGDYQASETYHHLPSQQEHGVSDGLEYDAPWLYTDAAGLTAWIENVVAPMLAYRGRALRRYTVRCSRAMLGVAPGDIVSWTDDDAPDAELGVYGMTSVKAWVTETSYDPRGEEVTLTLLRPTGRNYASPPSLMLDYDRGDKGYDVAGPYLYFRQHEFSYTSEADDVSRLSVSDKIRIVEVDPATPASPTTWTRTVSAVTPASQRVTLDSALSAPAFDTAKRYYVEFDDYVTVQVSQETSAYIADNATRQILATDPPFLWGSFAPSVESATPTAIERFRRPYSIAYADGEPMSPHKLRDIGRAANNLYAHVTNQHPIARMFQTERGTASLTYVVLVTPFVVHCPNGATTLDVTLFIRAAIPTGGAGDGTFRVTCTPTHPTGTMTAAVFAVDKQQLVINTVSETTEKRTGQLTLQPGADGRAYVTLEAFRTTGEAWCRGISCRVADRSVV